MAFGEESFTQAKISPCFHKVRVLVLIVETLALVHTDNPYCHNTHPIQCSCSGWPKGNGKILSSSHAQLCQATCLAVA